MNARTLSRLAGVFPFAVMLAAFSACSILDGPIEPPTSAHITIGGPGPGPLLLITSNEFIYTYDQFGNQREDVLAADTSLVEPGYERELPMGPGVRIYISVGQPPEAETVPVIDVRMEVRDEAICENISIPLEEEYPWICSYIYNG